MAKKKTAPEPVIYQIGEVRDGFVVTKAGLPNTCSVTGKEITEDYWFARSEDAARSGSGISQAAFEAQGE